MDSTTDALARPFEPAELEQRLRKFWDENSFYQSHPNPAKKAFTIVIPPPNITGELHVGHMLNNTIQDILIRWNRAAGLEACWIPGTDHASIATEAKVTAKIEKEGRKKSSLTRDEFLKECWAWKDIYGNRIVEALKRLGISCDWKRERFTMDEAYSKSVLSAFIKLYQDGLVYRGHRLVNWCPSSQSVISDEEVYFEEKNSSLWKIRYKLADSEEYLVVATTRPETLFGDLAVAVHPDDARYKKFIGKQVQVPLTGRSVRVIADTYVDPSFGTGCLKVTPAHDMNDFELGQKHGLGVLNVMNPDASLNDQVPVAYRGLDRFVARKKLVRELESTGLLDSTEPYKTKIGMSERGRVPVEYYLSQQWYVRMKPLAEKALDATRSKRLTLIPSHAEKTWEHWLTHIQDWCVSRQLYWGHRIPVFTCQSCKNEWVSVDIPKSCPKCRASEIEQDPDVLDTWASSWLWPFAVHSWPNKSPDLDYYFPSDVIVTGQDIIFFWIARMVMAGEYFLGKTPFHHVYFTGLIRDGQGRKMSKSLGNSPDIFKLIDEYGTDAFRFALVNQTVTGQDIHWADESCAIGKNFCNKIWNATRFLLMQSERLEMPLNKLPSFEDLSQVMDRKDPLQAWIYHEFCECVRACEKAVDQYEFSAMSSKLYEFLWAHFCDWYVEFLKTRMSDPKLARSTLMTGFALMDGVLRLLHPIMPYITEELSHRLYPTRAQETLGHKPMPQSKALAPSDNFQTVSQVIATIVGIRSLRGHYSISQAVSVDVFIEASASQFGSMAESLSQISRSKIHFGAEPPLFSAPASGTPFVTWLSLEGHVDAVKERARIEKRILEIKKHCSGLEAKLANEKFVQSAPQNILEGARVQLSQNQAELQTLEQARLRLPS
jgi:valyl-tRNA synthetase